MTDASPKLLRAHDGYRDDEPLVRRRALAVVKHATRSVVRAPRNQRKVVLIFGCQRSGTTMLQQTVLDRSWRVLIIEEHDRRVVGRHHEPGETAWQDYTTVLQRLRRAPFELVVAKPLVESDRATELMDAAQPVKAIWMLRHYDGVARSNVKRFGMDNPYRDLQPFCDGDLLDWRCRGAAKETRETVIELMREGLSPLDAAALFWWARNQLYFDQHLPDMNEYGSSAMSKPAIVPTRWSRHPPTTSELRCPLSSITSKVRPQPEVPEVPGLHPRLRGSAGRHGSPSPDVPSSRENGGAE